MANKNDSLHALLLKSGVSMNRVSSSVATSLLGLQSPSAGIQPIPVSTGGVSVASLLLGLSVKRKAFFSFHYDDVFRVNNVRNAFKVYNPNTQLTPTFYDSSLWESRKLEGEDALKRLIREGVGNTSVVCVLVGTETWNRPWVRYEIARSVIDERGLLAVDINHINHHKTQKINSIGINPLSYLGVGRTVDGQFRLFEKKLKWNGLNYQFSWEKYEKHVHPVALPRYLKAPQTGYVSPLDQGTPRYNFISDHGHFNIGRWLDFAAKQVGR